MDAKSAPPKPWYRLTVRRAMALVVVAALGAGGARLVLGAREEARCAQCQCMLKQLALGLHNYHESNGCFPPAYVAGPDGKPWHSWRTLIVPYMESTSWYNRYNFSEPWDGPNNWTLITSNIYHMCPSHRDGPSVFADYVAVVGPGTAFPGAGSTTLSDVRDGTSASILLVECADLDIPWTEPRDLTLAQLSGRLDDPSGPSPSSRHPRGVNVVFVDGHIETLPPGTPPARVKAMLTIAGGDGPGPAP